MARRVRNDFRNLPTDVKEVWKDNEKEDYHLLNCCVDSKGTVKSQ